MKQRTLILFLVFLCTNSIQLLFGQSLANYKSPTAIARTTGITYNSIEFTGNAVPSWRFTGAGAEDDDRSYPVNIGFDFWYLGTRYTTFSVSTNGFIDFSSAANNGGPSTNQYGSTDNDLSQPSTATTRTMPLTIAPFYYDQTTDTTGGGLDALGNGIKYLTSGTVGSRVLTVEWIRLQPWYSGAVGHPQFNYQVKLYEGTGVIEFVYGTMNIGTFSFASQTVNIVQGYTSGMNGTSISNPPTAVNMLVQQTVNTATFSNAGVTGNPADVPHTLQTLPATNSLITFTPPVPIAPTGISFTSVTQTSMQVNWTRVVSSDIGYVLYRSDDGGASYNFITQLPATTNLYNQTGLLSGTTYYWRIYAVSEGAFSTALTGSQATTAPGNDTSKVSVSTLWSDPLTWKSGVVPTSSSNVVIDDGTTVTINQNVTVNSLSIGKGTSGILQIGNDATARTVSVTGTIDVRSGGTFKINTASVTSSHILNTSGNIQNSGTFDMSPNASSRATVNFIKSGTQSVSGPGSTTRFYLMTMNLGGSASNFLDVFATNFSSTTTNYLTITSGIFNLATGVTTTPFTGNVTIPLIGGLRVNHSSAVLNTTGGSLTIVGELRVMSGTLNVGNASDNNLISNGGIFIFSGGAVNVAGRFDQANSYALTNLTISGGILTVNTTGSTSTTSAPFNMNVPGSTFNMSGGTIIIQNPGNPGGQNLGFVNTSYTSYSMTGGIIQIGNASTPAASTIRVNSSIPVYNFLVNSSNVTAQLITNNLSVLNDVTITLGTLNANALNMTVAGNWLNNATFTPSTGKVTFNGIGSQSITDPTGESFNKLTINTVSTLSLVNNVAVADSFALSAGTIDVATTTLTLNGIVVGGGTLTSSITGTVNYNKNSNGQTVLTANYGNIKFSNFLKTLPASPIGIAGTFTPGNAYGHTTTGNTINYSVSDSQNIAPFRYNNLTLSGTGTKTVFSLSDTVVGTLNISGVTLDNAALNMVVLGSIINNGSHTGTSGSLVAGGTLNQSISGNGSFKNLTIKNAAGATISGSKVITGILNFTSGVITANTDTVILSSTGSILRTAGHVNGWFQKAVTTTGANIMVYFEIGDAINFTPARFQFANVTATGKITARSVSSEHPNILTSYIDPTDDVNRYWELINSGDFAYTIASGYDATLKFINPGDQDQTVNVLTYRMNINNGIRWDSSATAGTRWADSTKATVDSLGAFVVGVQVVSGMYRSNVPTGNWGTAGSWQRFNGTTWVTAVAAPSSADGLITIRSGHTITVAANVTIDQTIVESGGVLVVNGGAVTLNAVSTNCLSVSGTLRMISNNPIVNTSATRLIFNAGSTFEHAYTTIAARIAIPTATWSPTSTVLFNGNVSNTSSGTLTASLAQSFGNFVWNPSAQAAAVDFSGLLTTVNGNFQVIQTGASTLNLFTTQTTNFTVGQSFIINNGTVTGKNNTGTVTVLIGGNDSITGGTLTLTSSGAFNKRVTGGLYVRGGTVNMTSAATTDSITLKGDLVLSGGIVTESGAGSGIIALQGTSDQILTSGATISNTINFIVLSGATLKTGTSVLSGNIFVLSSGATLKIGSTVGISSSGATGNIQTTTRTYSSLANYIYEGSLGQITGVFTTTPTANTVFDLEINNSAGVTLSNNIAVNDTLKLSNGNLGVSTFTLSINNAAVLTSGTLSSAVTGTVIYNKSSAGQTVIALNYGNLTFSDFSKILPSSGIVGIAGTFTKGLASPTSHTITGSTVDFNGAAQVIPKFTFNNLTFSSSGTRTVDSSITVNGTLTLSAGTLALSSSSVIVTTKGNIVNNAATSGSGKIMLNGGSTVHSLSGSGTYNNLDINDAVGATTSSDITVNGTATLTSGVFGMGGNAFIVGSSGTTVQTLGYVNGNMKKTVPVNALPQTITFEVGDAAAYAPVSLTFNAVSVAGTLTVSTTGADHPVIKYSGLDQYKDANRYWTLTNSGITFTTYDITLNFVAGDLDVGANTNAFFSKRYNTLWFASTTVLRNSSWIKNLGNSAFGDFATGEVATVIYWTKGAGTYNWGDDNNWSINSQPTAFNDIIFDGKDTIEVNVPGTTKNLILQNDTLRLTVLAGKTLSVSGNLTHYSGVFSTRASFPTVSGITSLMGGTFGYDSSGGTQTIAVQSYQNLRISGGGTKTAAGVFTVNKNLTIGSGATFADGGNILTINDSVFNNGIHSGVGKLLLNGPTQQYISGVGSFSMLELNNTNGAKLRGSISISTLAMTLGTMNTGTDSVTITNTRTGNGIIIGKIRRLHTFLPTVSYEFESPNNTIYFNNGGSLPTSVTVTVVLDSSAITNTYMNPINRYYDITQFGGSGYQYKLRLHYEDSELGSANSEMSPSLKIWKNDSLDVAVWNRLGADTNNTVNNWVQWNTVSSIGRFSLSSKTIANLVLTLSSNVINPAPGDTVTYTISYNNTGDGNATNVLIVAAVPTKTIFASGSIKVNSIATPDATSGVTINSSAISFNLSTLISSSILPAVNGNITYKVVIN